MDLDASQETPVKIGWNGRAIAVVLAFLPVACSSVADYPYMKEGEPYAEGIVRAIGREWNADELIKVADPRMLAIASEAEIRAMITTCSVPLGRIKAQRTYLGSIGFETAISGKVAAYEIDVDGEKGTGRIKIKLQKVGEQWKVLGFWCQGQPFATPSQ